MLIGMVDCDNKNSKNPFPNLALMKISAWHKNKGDQVQWLDPLFDMLGEIHYDKVYISKVFSFSPDYEYPINADEIVRGGVDLQ